MYVERRVELFSIDLEANTGEPNFWSSDLFCKHSANARTIMLDFGTRLFDVVFSF